MLRRTGLAEDIALTPLMPTAANRRPRAGSLAALLVACALGVAFAGSGFGDEGRTIAGGDAPRYLMNGAYFLDLLHDRPVHSVAEFIDYTRYYYARYPALSLGHHPVLLSLAEVPLFAAAGISLAAGRAVVIASFICGIVLIWALARHTHGDLAGALAALLVATNPYLIWLGQVVLAELPGITLLLACAYFLERFCTSQRRSDLYLFSGSAVLALYAKHLTAFAVPGFLAYALLRLGWRRLLRRDVLAAAIVCVVLLAPLVPMTLMLARSNVAFVRGQMTGASSHAVGGPGWLLTRADAVSYALVHQFSPPVLAFVAAGAALAAARRDRAVQLYALWAGSVALCIVFVTGSLEPTRYSAYWVPPLLAIAATVGASARRHHTGRLLLAVSVGVIAFQTWLGARTPAPTTSGYEAVARFVTEQPPAPTVLFSGEIDSGLFVFFVRKHDPGRRQIVLRADKVLTTSFMQHASIEDRISSPAEIYDVLRRYGTRFVVVEDRLTSTHVLGWMLDAVRTDRFIERFHVPLVSDDPRLQHASLRVYEFRGATPPDPDAIFDVRLPLVGQNIALPLSGLLHRRFLR